MFKWDLYVFSLSKVGRGLYAALQAYSLRMDVSSHGHINQCVSWSDQGTPAMTLLVKAIFLLGAGALTVAARWAMEKTRPSALKPVRRFFVPLQYPPSKNEPDYDNAGLAVLSFRNLPPADVIDCVTKHLLDGPKRRAVPVGC